MLSSVASFSAGDTYVLRLTANDSELAATSEVTITVIGDGGANRPPVVMAGPDLNGATVSPVPLSGSVTDDGAPAGNVITAYWTQISGPGEVHFARSEERRVGKEGRSRWSPYH